MHDSCASPCAARHAGGLALARRTYDGFVVPPVVYLLCGLTGSGKTAYAKRLEAEGCARLSIDELVHARHGRYDVDYPASHYPRHYEEAVSELDRRLVELLEANQSVVLDHGLWQRLDRDRYKALVEAQGGRWELLYFKVEPSVLRRRLAQRNQQGGANALIVSDDMLTDFIARFEAPSGEGERVLSGGDAW